VQDVQHGLRDSGEARATHQVLGTRKRAGVLVNAQACPQELHHKLAEAAEASQQQPAAPQVPRQVQYSESPARLRSIRFAADLDVQCDLYWQQALLEDSGDLWYVCSITAVRCFTPRPRQRSIYTDTPLRRVSRSSPTTWTRDRCA
jgi:hypothetical protein